MNWNCYYEIFKNSQLLVIMEIRCSDDYATFITQKTIEEYSRRFLKQFEERVDVSDSDFTDYEVKLTNWLLSKNIVHFILENNV